MHNRLNLLNPKRTLFTLPILIMLLLTACGAAQPTQAPTRVFKIGIISGGTQFDNVVVGFKAGLGDQGYVEGKNVVYVYDGPVSAPDKLSLVADNLVAAKVDLIYSLGTPATQAAQKATATVKIPVVFVPVSDPVHDNIVQSLTNPGDNLTGVATGVQVHAQRLEWLLKIDPKVKRVFLPFDPTDAAGARIVKVVQDAAPKLGVEIVTQEVHTADDVTAIITSLPQNIDAVFVVPSTLIGVRLKDLIQACTDHKIPLTSNVESQVNLGALVTYSFGDNEAGKQVARMADRILKGAKPADLPIETSEFFLAVNLKTAQAIDLTIPDDILRQAATIVRDTGAATP